MPATLINLSPSLFQSRLILKLLWSVTCLIFSQAHAQSGSPIASPAGSSATQVLGHYSEREGYVDGKWIQIFYGRPIKRQRQLFDLPDWREAMLDGAQVWRAGANVSTRLSTETDLVFGNVRVPAGEYTIFIDFGVTSDTLQTWSFILSSWQAQLQYDYENKEALWGAYDYSSDKDIVRVPMSVNRGDVSFDQLSWQFANMHDGKGELVLLWDKIKATVAFSY